MMVHSRMIGTFKNDRYVVIWLSRAHYNVQFSRKSSRTGESPDILYFHLFFFKYVIKKTAGDVSTTCRIAAISFNSNINPKYLQ